MDGRRHHERSMGGGGSRPPFEQMPRPLCMGSRRWQVACMAMLIPTAPSTLALQDGETGEDLDEYGQLYDVRIITAECLENATCEPTKPTHLVEYFSADWCEPCHEVSNQLANMTLDGAVVCNTMDLQRMQRSSLRQSFATISRTDCCFYRRW